MFLKLKLVLRQGPKDVTSGVRLCLTMSNKISSDVPQVTRMSPNIQFSQSKLELQLFFVHFYFLDI